MIIWRVARTACARNLALQDTGMSNDIDREDKQTVRVKIQQKQYKLCPKSGMRSEAWDKFWLVTTQDDQKVGYVCCKYCSTLLSFSSTTTHLKNHVCKSRAEIRPDVDPSDLKAALMQKCIQMCVTDLCPVNIVSGIGFQHFCQELINIGANYGHVNIDSILPHSTNITKCIQKRAEEIRAKVMPQIIYAAENYSCACILDLRPDPYRKGQLLTIGAHFIDDEWLLKHCILISTPLTDITKAKEGLKEEIKEKLAELGIIPEYTEKISFVIGQEQDIQKALEGYTYYPCIASCISTVLEIAFDDAFLQSELLKCYRTISAAKRIANFMNKLGIVEYPEVTMERRWYSLLSMLNVLVSEHCKVVEALTSRSATDKLEGYDHKVAQDLIQFLNIFKEAMDALEADADITIQFVLLWVHKLKNHCVTTNEDTFEIGKLKERTRYLLEERVRIQDIHKIGTFLCPAFRKLKLLTSEEKEETFSTVRHLCSEVKLEVICEETERPSLTKQMKLSFAEWQDDGDESVGNNEVDKYVSRDHVEDDDEPLRWWKTYSSVYPKLAEIARRTFCVPATKTSIERTFSAVASLMMEDGTMLDLGQISDILLVHSIDKNFNV